MSYFSTTIPKLFLYHSEITLTADFLFYAPFNSPIPVGSVVMHFKVSKFIGSRKYNTILSFKDWATYRFFDQDDVDVLLSGIHAEKDPTFGIRARLDIAQHFDEPLEVMYERLTGIKVNG